DFRMTQFVPKKYVAEQIELESMLDNLAEENDNYLHGECHIFALALQEISGLPLYAITDTDWNIEAQCLVHAGVKYQGGLIDVKGFREFSAIYDEFEAFEPEESAIEEMELLQLGA